jgi:hypothetical protein
MNHILLLEKFMSKEILGSYVNWVLIKDIEHYTLEYFDEGYALTIMVDYINNKTDGLYKLATDIVTDRIRDKYPDEKINEEY